MATSPAAPTLCSSSWMVKPKAAFPASPPGLGSGRQAALDLAPAAQAASARTAAPLSNYVDEFSGDRDDFADLGVA